MTVTVLTQPMCSPCSKVKKYFSDKGIDYVERDVTTDVEAFEMLKSMNYQSTPVIIAGEDHWPGIDLRKMKELVARV